MEVLKYQGYTINVYKDQKIVFDDSCPMLSGSKLDWNCNLSIGSNFKYSSGNMIINNVQVLKDGKIIDYTSKFKKNLNE